MTDPLKMNYQEFIKDIYNAIKRTTQFQGDILAQLTNINNRLASLESSYVQLSRQVQEIAETNSKITSPAYALSPENKSALDEKLLGMMSKLETTELPELYKINTEFQMAELLGNDAGEVVNANDKNDKTEKHDEKHDIVAAIPVTGFMKTIEPVTAADLTDFMIL